MFLQILVQKSALVLILRSFSQLLVGREIVLSVEDRSLYSLERGFFELAIILMFSISGGD